MHLTITVSTTRSSPGSSPRQGLCGRHAHGDACVLFGARSSETLGNKIMPGTAYQLPPTDRDLGNLQ